LDRTSPHGLIDGSSRLARSDIAIIQNNYNQFVSHIRSVYGFNSQGPVPSEGLLLGLFESRNVYRKENKRPFIFVTNDIGRDETVQYSFLWDGMEIYFFSSIINGRGSYSYSQRLVKLIDFTVPGGCFEFYNFLLPSFQEDYALLRNDYQLAAAHAKKLNIFSKPSPLFLHLMGGEKSSRHEVIVPALIEKSSNGWATLATLLHNNFDEELFPIAVIQGLVCLLYFQEIGVDFGDLSANNLILFPQACGYVPIDLSTLQFSKGVKDIPTPISTFFDPELGPYQRGPQVDRFSLAMNMLFVSVHFVHRHDIKQAMLFLSTLCQSSVFLSDTMPGDISQTLDQYKAVYFQVSGIITKHVDFPELFTVLMQFIHPDSLQRPSLLDIFNRIEIGRLVIGSIKKMALAHYSLSQNIEISDDLRCLLSGTSLDEKVTTVQASPEISGLIFLSLLIYCCHNKETDPSAIRDQMNKLLALVNTTSQKLSGKHRGMIHRYESRFPEPAILEQIMNSMVDEFSHDILAEMSQEEYSTQFKSRKKETESPTTVHTFFSALSCDEGNNAMLSQIDDGLYHLSK